MESYWCKRFDKVREEDDDDVLVVLILVIVVMMLIVVIVSGLTLSNQEVADQTS